MKYIGVSCFYYWDRPMGFCHYDIEANSLEEAYEKGWTIHEQQEDFPIAKDDNWYVIPI